MKKMICLATFAATVVTSPAHAQPAADNSRAQAEALGQCLTLKTTGADRVALAKWILAALASIPRLKDVATIDPAKKDVADRGMATLVTRLLTADCAAEAKPLFKTGGKAGIEIAFGVLGRIAMQEVTQDPEAGAAMGSFGQYIDEKAFANLTK